MAGWKRKKVSFLACFVIFSDVFIFIVYVGQIVCFLLYMLACSVELSLSFILLTDRMKSSQ